MASGAAASAVSPSAATHWSSPMVGVSGGAASRSRRRTVVELAPSPARFTSGNPPGTNPTEDAVAGCINDHAEHLKSLTANMAAAKVKLEQHEIKTGMLDAALTDMAERLKEMERRESEKEATLIEKLQSHEQQTTATHEVVSALTQHVSDVGASGQASADGHLAALLAVLDAKCDASFKKLEEMIGEVDRKHQGQGEQLHGNVHATIAQMVGRVSEVEAMVRMWSQAGGAGPATAPQQTAGASAYGTTLPATTPSGAGFGRPSGPSGGNFPEFDPAKRSTAAFQQMGGGDSRKPIFDEKTAVAPNMQYRANDRLAWIKTTQNYLIGKAPEMTWLLDWAESAQERTISSQHVAAASNFGYCFDVEPMKLSHELWTYLNLALGDGKEKLAFNNVERSNGFEAWRKLVVPAKPRSKARVHLMHRDVHNPPMSRGLQHVMEDIDAWEGQVTEFVAAGGAPLPEITKVISAMGILPKDTPTYVKMQLKDIEDLESFKDNLRQNIQFMNDFTNRGAPGAHLLEDPRSPMPGGGSIESPTLLRPEEFTIDDLPAHVVEDLGREGADQVVLAVNAARRGQAPQGKSRGFRPQPKRAATPPRDAKDVKCGNCGGTGHTAQQCTKPRIPMEERKCHNCGKAGHQARNCPEKRKANVAEEAPAANRVLCMEDDEGFTTVSRRHTPAPLTLGDMPVIAHISQGERRRAATNRFGVLGNGIDESTEDCTRKTNSQRPGREIRREEFSLCRDYAQASGRGGECLSGCPCNLTASPEPANVRGTNSNIVCGTANVRDVASNEAEPSRATRAPEALPSGGPVGADEVWELVEDAIHENERIIASPPWPIPPAMDPFNLCPGDRKGCFAHSAEGQWEILRQLAISEGNRQAASSKSPADEPARIGCHPSGGDDVGEARHNGPPAVSSIGSCTAFSYEPNTTVGPLVDSETWRRYRSECIRQRINPDQLRALEAIDMADEVVQRALLMEHDGLGDDIVMNMEWHDMDVEIALDSGCCDHIMDVEELAPGYSITESERSRRGAGFIVGNGERLSNEGEAILNLEAVAPGSPGVRFRSTFQAAKVSRPLMSVSKICRNGYKCTFDDAQALIVDEKGQTVCRFVERNGIYLATVKLKSPTPFGGPAR